MSKKSQVAPSGAERFGNTKVRPNCMKHWVFTWNNYPGGAKDLIINLGGAKIIVAQEEVGEQGTPHIQGYVEFNKKCRPMGLLPESVHWEKCSNVKASIEYCRKDSTRSGWRLEIGVRAKLSPKIINYRPWQAELDILLHEEPDERTINWYWEKTGCTGKTTFARDWCIKHPNETLYVSGKSADIKFGIQKFLESNKNTLKYIFIDVPRTNIDYVSYEAIESIKNGIFFSGKYESGMVMFESPHVVIFANEEPKYDKVSADRWRVLEINDRA